MISQTAWDNFRWLQKGFLDDLDNVKGSLFTVESFRPYFPRNWVTNLDPTTARRQFLQEVAEWAERLKTFSFTREWRMDHWDKSIQVARGGEEYSRLLNFMFRAHYNLYCLSYNRKTIEELALSAYVYCSRTIEHTEKIDKAARADFRRLLKLSNTFLLAEWVHDMIERAISNDDEKFFNIISNSVKVNFLHDSSGSAMPWLLVALLWFLGGKDYGKRRDFLHDLHQNDILNKKIDEYSFNAELRRLGLTTG